MARPSVQETVSRWQQGTAQAQPRYSQGIQNSKDWAGAAVAAAPARNAGLQRAIANGDIDRGIQRVGTAGWRQRTMAKGPQNWLSGVTSAGAQYTAGVQRLYSFLDSADNAVSNMPRGGFAENMARMTAYVTAVHDASQQSKSQ